MLTNINDYLIPRDSEPKFWLFQYPILPLSHTEREFNACSLDITKLEDGSKKYAALLSSQAFFPGYDIESMATAIYYQMRVANLVESPDDIQWFKFMLFDDQLSSTKWIDKELFKVCLAWLGGFYQDKNLENVSLQDIPFDLDRYLEKYKK